jgi:hypothetical protein
VHFSVHLNTAIVKKFVSFSFFGSVDAVGARGGHTCFLIATVDVVVERQTGGPENCFGPV